MTLTWDAAPLLVYGVLAQGLALLLVYLNLHHRSNRAFALFLSISGFTALFPALVLVADSPADAAFWRRLAPYPYQVVWIAAVYFYAVYPKPRRWLPRAPWGSLLFLVPMGLITGLYALDHRLYADASQVLQGTLGASAAPGPLFVVRTLGTPFFLAVPLLLARDGAREPPGLRRRSLLLVSAAFALPLAYVIWLNGLWVAGGGNVYPGFAGAALNFTYVANVALTLATAGFAAHQALRSPDEELRRWFRGMTAALVLVVVSVAIVALAAPEDLRRAPPPFFAGLVAFVFGLWLLVRDQALVYALLRTQLFDIDVKVRWTIKQSTVAGVFIGVFFIVSEAAQQVLSTTVGPVIGIVAAGALLFALAPLQHAAERVASAAVPGAKAAGDMTTDERRRAYLDAARLAWADGSISKDERAMLEQFRASLGIAEQEAYRIEREAAKGGA